MIWTKNAYFLVIAIILSTQCVGQDGPKADDDGPSFSGKRGSRIIDDTTKQIYGPTTSRYFYEEDAFYNNDTYYFIDTVIRNFHKYTYLQRHNYLYQDLGNIGTPARPLYYEVPDAIGANSGIRTLDLYWEADRIRYFDTKSPYTKISAALGGKGRSMTDIGFSRNINPRWNFGFDYKTLLIDKQIQRRGKGDRNVRRTYWDLYTTYQSKDSTYRLFTYLARTRHQVYENGGVRDDFPDFSSSDYFAKDNLPWLTTVENRELRIKLHLYHEYKIGKALQVYHKFDRYRQGRDFYDNLATSQSYYDTIIVDSATVRDEVKFVSLRNEAGIKGSVSKLFYNAYYAIRNYSMEYNYLDENALSIKAKGVENYLGGRIALQLDSLLQLRSHAEIQQVRDEFNFQLQGKLVSKWFEFFLKQKSYTPGFMQQAYRGSHDYWDQKFSNIEVTQLGGSLIYNSKWLHVAPGFSFTRLKDYVFFQENTDVTSQQVLPVQTSGNQIYSNPNLDIWIGFLRNFRFSAKGIYTTFIENEENALRIPEWFLNGQLSYSNILFRGNLDMQIGVDAHWHSTYNPMGYDVAIQQFYNQDTFTANSFPLIDAFFNARIKRARIFVKYHNVVQAFTKQGYFPTAYYPGQRAIIDFGFDWSFYD